MLSILLRNFTGNALIDLLIFILIAIIVVIAGKYLMDALETPAPIRKVVLLIAVVLIIIFILTRFMGYW